MLWAAASAAAAPKIDQKIAKGKDLYSKNLCETCHGQKFEGGIGNPLVGEKAEDFISQAYIEEFVGEVYAHRTNPAELAKVQEKFNQGPWKKRKKPLTMVGTMGATLSASTLSKDDITAIAAYISSARGTKAKK
jgi:cytochrome c553